VEVSDEMVQDMAVMCFHRCSKDAEGLLLLQAHGRHMQHAATYQGGRCCQAKPLTAGTTPGLMTYQLTSPPTPVADACPTLPLTPVTHRVLPLVPGHTPRHTRRYQPGAQRRGRCRRRRWCHPRSWRSR
jgi:hypothetical protein